MSFIESVAEVYLCMQFQNFALGVTEMWLVQVRYVCVCMGVYDIGSVCDMCCSGLIIKVVM